jgi:hypothetical protein
MNNKPEWTPPPWIERIVLGLFVAVLVLTAVAMVLFVRIGA